MCIFADQDKGCRWEMAISIRVSKKPEQAELCRQAEAYIVAQLKALFAD